MMQYPQIDPVAIPGLLEVLQRHLMSLTTDAELVATKGGTGRPYSLPGRMSA